MRHVPTSARVSNADHTQAVQQRRRSGASGLHATGGKRQRDRGGARRAAIHFSRDSG